MSKLIVKDHGKRMSHPIRVIGSVPIGCVFTGSIAFGVGTSGASLWLRTVFGVLDLHGFVDTCITLHGLETVYVSQFLEVESAVLEVR